MTTRTFLAAAAASLATLALSACGSDSGGSTAGTVPADVNVEVISGPGIKFDKAEYTAQAGTVKIALVNHDGQTHTLDLVDPDGSRLPGELKVGKSGEVAVGSFDLPAGKYKVLCLIPGHTAMKATLLVTG